MISLPSLAALDRLTDTRIWLAIAPTDMSRSFDRLAEMARGADESEPDGRASVFVSFAIG